MENIVVKAPRSAPIGWTPMREMTLVTVVMKYKAHKKTKEATMEDKWGLVSQELSLHGSFAEFKLDAKKSVETFKKKYSRLRSDVEKRYSLTEEGANLSGLPETASEVEQILYNIIVDQLTTEREKAVVTAKQKKREASMLTHEANTAEAAKRIDVG
jgi:hypothetical protein